MEFGVSDPGENEIRVVGVKKENGVFPCSCGLSSFTEIEHLKEGSPATGRKDVAGSASEYLTPTEKVFNPFAPGPEELMLAPKKRMLKLARDPFMRKLDFDSCCDFAAGIGGGVKDDALTEKELMELLCYSFLDLVINSQVGRCDNEGLREKLNSGISDVVKTPTIISALSGESNDESSEEKIVFADGLKKPPPALSVICGEFFEEKLCGRLDFSDGSRTPTTLPFLSGVAEACPGAPMRPGSISRDLAVMGICRKLEF